MGAFLGRPLKTPFDDKDESLNLKVSELGLTKYWWGKHLAWNIGGDEDGDQNE